MRRLSDSYNVDRQNIRPDFVNPTLQFLVRIITYTEISRLKTTGLLKAFPMMIMHVHIVHVDPFQSLDDEQNEHFDFTDSDEEEEISLKINSKVSI